MTRLAFAACLTACLGGPSSAETDLLHLTPTERAILGQEIRAVLLTVLCYSKIAPQWSPRTLGVETPTGRTAPL